MQGARAGSAGSGGSSSVPPAARREGSSGRLRNSPTPKNRRPRPQTLREPVIAGSIVGSRRVMKTAARPLIASRDRIQCMGVSACFFIPDCSMAESDGQGNRFAVTGMHNKTNGEARRHEAPGRVEPAAIMRLVSLDFSKRMPYAASSAARLNVQVTEKTELAATGRRPGVEAFS